MNRQASFNFESEKYESPTITLHFGILIKKCWENVLTELIKIPNTEEQEDKTIMKGWNSTLTHKTFQ